MKILDTTISRVCIVDDDESGAESMREIIDDADFEPDVIALPLDEDIKAAATFLADRGDAVVCDHHLSERGPAAYNGAALLAELYDLQCPAVLHTNWVDVLEIELRRDRRRVPVLISGAESEPDRIRAGFKLCVHEFGGEYSASRRPWRTPIHIEQYDVDRGLVFLLIPEWDPHRRVSMPLDILPTSLQAPSAAGTDFMAAVNVRAEDFNDLYITEIETPNAQHHGP